jgi:hypothetical protein
MMISVEEEADGNWLLSSSVFNATVKEVLYIFKYLNVMLINWVLRKHRSR